ncbi:MAG: hypothetical protein ACO3UU_07440 [Minisyncoccia bacterium]
MAKERITNQSDMIDAFFEGSRSRCTLGNTKFEGNVFTYYNTNIAALYEKGNVLVIDLEYTTKSTMVKINAIVDRWTEENYDYGMRIFQKNYQMFLAAGQENIPVTTRYIVLTNNNQNKFQTGVTLYETWDEVNSILLGTK